MHYNHKNTKLVVYATFEIKVTYCPSLNKMTT